MPIKKSSIQIGFLMVQLFSKQNHEEANMKKFLGIIIVLISLAPLHSAIKFRTSLTGSFLTGVSVVPEVDFGNFALGASVGYLFIDSEKSEVGPSFSFFLGYTDIPGEKGVYTDVGLEFLYTPIEMLNASVNVYVKTGYSFNELFRLGVVTRFPVIPNIGEEYDILSNVGQMLLIALIGVGVEFVFTF